MEEKVFNRLVDVNIMGQKGLVHSLLGQDATAVVWKGIARSPRGGGAGSDMKKARI